MIEIMRIATVAALGLFCTWAANKWLNLWGADNFYTAAGVWLAFMIGIAFIYDRRQAKLQKSSDATQPGQISRES